MPKGDGASRTIAKTSRKGKGTKTGGRKAWGSKQVLGSPYVTVLPPGTDATDALVSKLIGDHLGNNLLRREARPKRGEEKQVDGSQKRAASNDSDRKKQGKKPKGLLIGVNEVTRGLEGGDVRVVVVSRDVSPDVLVAHIPALCCVAQSRLITVCGQGDLLGAALGSKRVLAIGVRVKCEGNIVDDRVYRLGEELWKVGKMVELPWLKAGAIGQMGEAVMLKHRGKRERAVGVNGRLENEKSR